MSYIGKNPKVDSVKLDGSATVPTGATVEGQVYFNTGTGAISEGLKVYKNGQYVSIDKQLGDADTIDLLKASDIGGLQWGVAINSTSTTVGMNSPVPQYNATATGFASTSAFANSSTGNALLTNESADIVFAYESGAANCKNDYFGIQVDIPKAFRGQNLVLQFEYRTEEASGASSDNDFLVSIQDDTNKAQTTNSTTTGSQAAGTSVAVASSTGFAVGDFVRVESGTAASGNSANSFTEAYVTAIADSTHLTFSETIVFPASGTTGIIAANWLINQNAGQLVEADSDTNKVGKVYKVQFKTEETTAKINISIMNQSTTTAGIDIFVDNILLSANKFLQASSQGQPEFYWTGYQGSFWSATGAATGDWNTALLQSGPGTPAYSNSKLISFTDATNQSVTVTRIYAKEKINLEIAAMGAVDSGDFFAICDSSDNALIREHQDPEAGADGLSLDINLSLTLAKDDYVYVYCANMQDANGQMNIRATALVSDVILLESQDEIFTDWQDWTPTGSWSSNVTYSGKWRRVGSEMEVLIMINATGAMGSTGSLTMDAVPSGYTVDENQLLYVGEAAAKAPTLGIGMTLDGPGGYASYATRVGYNGAGSNEIAILVEASNGTYGYYEPLTHTAPHSWATGDYAWANYKVPIQGWNANFNPLLSMPLVEIGGNVEQWSGYGYAANGTTNSYRPVVDHVNAGNTVSSLGTVNNSSSLGWNFLASQRCRATLNVSWSQTGTEAGSYSISLIKKNTLGTNVNDGNTVWNGYKVARATSVSHTTPCEISGSVLLEPGDYLFPVTNATTSDPVDDRAVLNFVVEKDFSNTNMAHIIKPAVAVVENVAGQVNFTSSVVDMPFTRIKGESWFVSLASNIVTLQPGTYKMGGCCRLYSGVTTAAHCAFALYNNDDAAYVHDFGGMTLYPADPAAAYGTQSANWTFVPAVITVTTETDFKVKGKSGTNVVANGIGSDDPFASEFGYATTVWIRNHLWIEKLK